MPENIVSLSKLKIISANVSGFGQKDKRIGFFLHIKTYEPDIILLCDTRLDKDSEKLVMNEVNFHCIFNSLSSDRRGVAILIKKSLPIKFDVIQKDNSGNSLTVRAEYDSKSFLLTCIYGPNEDDPDFIQTQFTQNAIINCPLQLIAGDFNITLDHSKDNFAYAAPRSSQSRTKLNELLEHHSFFDVFRSFYPNRKSYTWKNPGGRQRARLDMFISSESLRPFIVAYKKLIPFRSDHDPILIEVDFAKFSSGKSYWKHNNSLIKDLEYVQRIKNHFRLTLAKYVRFDNFNNFYTEATEEELQDFLNKDSTFYFNQNYNVNPQLLFEMLLNDARCESISYSAEKNRQEKAVEKRLSENYKIAKNASELNPDDVLSTNNLTEAKNEYNSFLEQKTKRYLMDHGISNKALGEKPSSYFLNLERNSNAQRYITSLVVNKNGQEIQINKQKDIETEIRNFYADLYSDKDENLTINNIENFMDEDLERLEYTKLSEAQALSLEGKITETEMLKVLKKANNDSAPGLSGFTYHFYKFFWSDLKFFILSAANYSFDIKSLPSSQSRGVISIIPKGSKRKDLLDNWRPLCMLNVFYKLVSGVIAMRINSILDTIIHENQSGFVRGRYIGDCIRTTHDVMSWAKNNNKTGMLLLIDFRKAYDSISFAFIEKALNFFGFGPDLISWVEILLKNFKASVIHAGHISELFDILVGCRQGDPVASPLFLIAIEIMCIKMRASSRINWFTVGNIKVLLSLYADDVSIFLPYQAEFLLAAIRILERFYLLSGLQLQKKKTQVCIFGKVPNGNLNICPELDLKWSQEFELLGIKFNGTLSNLEINIESKMSEIDKITSYWKYRFLSPLGKAVIAKSLLLSKINHIAFSVPTLNKTMIKKIEDKIYGFIWSGPDKVARADAKKNENEGGLALPDIHASWSAFKFSWLRRLEKTSSTWVDIFKDSLLEYRANLTIENLLYKTGTAEINRVAKNMKNSFWKEVLLCYKPMLTNFLKKYPDNILNVPIWDSHSFLKSNKPISRTGFASLRNIVTFPSDLLAVDGGTLQFIDHAQAEIKFNTTIDPLQYLSLRLVLRNAIALLRFNLPMHVQILPERPAGKVLINLTDKGCSKWTTLIKKKCNRSIVHCEQKWEENLGNVQGVRFWDRSYHNVRNIFFDNKIKLLYYFTVRGTLRTNRIVRHQKREVSPDCSYCNNNIETISHLFWYCPEVERFITQIRDMIEACLPNYYTRPTFKQFIFGHPDEPIHGKNNILNLYIKSFIWKTKFKTRTLNTSAFFNWLKFEWQLNLKAFPDNRLAHLLALLESLDVMQ